MFCIIMVCGGKCSCGEFCRRLFCRTRPSEIEKSEITNNTENDTSLSVKTIELAEAQNVTFTLPLTEPLTIGAHIVCTGTPCDNIPRIAIDIGNGDVETGRADIAVHFNVRFPQRYVVRNTRRNGKWGYEETTSHRTFPFQVDRTFTIEVIVEEKETIWAVDGEYYCEYTHRNPSPFVATWIQVTGVKDAALLVQKTDTFPTLAPALVEVPWRTCFNGPIEDEEPSWPRNVTASLSKGVLDGQQVVVHGRLRPILHSFAIDLMDDSREWPRPNIVVHVAVRAHDDSQSERQLVVLNTRLGAWGAERRQRTAKLIPGTQTIFRVVRGPAEWTVFADNVVIGEIEHRCSPNAVKTLRLRGDLYPEQIYLCPVSNSPHEERI